MKTHPGNGAGLFLGGPAVFVLLLAFLAVVLLIAWGMRRQDPLLSLGERARQRLDRGRTLPTLWGLSASVLIFAVSVLLFHTHVLALLGVLLLAAGLGLAGGGLAVTAWAVGDDLEGASGSRHDDGVSSLRLGLAVLFLASWLPIIGWLAAALAAAAGLGAVLEALLTRERLE